MSGWIEKVTKGKAPYKFGEKIKPYSKKKSSLLCPECAEPVILRCLCPMQDSECKNGHKWHIDRLGPLSDPKPTIVKGHGH